MSADKENVEQQIQDLAALADAGELAGALAHEVNNFLNVLLLQLVLLEHKAPPEARRDLREVHRQGKQLGEFVKHWQRSRAHSAPAQPIDLNYLLQQLDFGTTDVAVRIEPAPNLPLISGIPADVRRLCTFLVKNAVSAARQGEQHILIRTESADGGVRLRVEDSGPRLSEESLVQFFDPAFVGRPGTDRLELAACRSIVRRMGGKISAENLPDSGIAVIIDWPLGS